MKIGWVVFPFLSLFWLVGLWLLGHGLWAARRSTQAAAWPTAPATLTRAELVEEVDEGSTNYKVEVRYTYAVGGVEYEGTRVAFGYDKISGGGRAARDEIVRKLRAAKSVAARYDPENPAVSCLSFGVNKSIRLALAFAAAWLSFMAWFTILIWLSSGRDTVLLDNLSVE